VAKGTLELIADTKASIRSLSLSDLSPSSTDYDRLSNLDLSSLTRLELEELEDDTIQQIFDIVLKSDPKNLFLTLIADLPSCTFIFLNHDLLRRVGDVRIISS
jgi:hypothetical protein